MEPRLVEPEHLAGADVALDGGADQVEGAALGGDDPVVADAAERERPDPVRVAERDERVVDEHDDRVGALEARHRGGDRLGKRGRVARDQRCDHLGVRGRAEPDPVRDELVAQGAGVRQVAVVAERDRARPPVVDERLRVRPVHAPGRRVARVTDRDLTRESLELLLVEDLGDEPHVAQHRQAPRLRDGDARRLLPAMLQREQREVRQPRHVAVGRADAEDAAHVYASRSQTARRSASVTPRISSPPTSPMRRTSTPGDGGHVLELVRPEARGSPGRGPRRRATTGSAARSSRAPMPECSAASASATASPPSETSCASVHRGARSTTSRTSAASAARSSGGGDPGDRPVARLELGARQRGRAGRRRAGSRPLPAMRRDRAERRGRGRRSRRPASAGSSGRRCRCRARRCRRRSAARAPRTPAPSPRSTARAPSRSRASRGCRS